MFLLLLTSCALLVVNGKFDDYGEYVTCINHKKFELTEDIQAGVSPEECAEICDKIKKCKSFEYNKKTMECRPQRKLKPDVKCKNPNPDEVLFSLPTTPVETTTAAPVPPGVPAAGKKSCFQTGGPNQLYMSAMDGTCKHLRVEHGKTVAECFDVCAEDAECTDMYADNAVGCVLFECPEADRIAVLEKLNPSSKHPGQWYGCKESKDRCPLVAEGGQVYAGTENPCDFVGQMEVKTRDECETRCLAEPDCDTFYFDAAVPLCGKLQCNPGITIYAPMSKMSATGKYYKCKDGSLVKTTKSCSQIGGPDQMYQQAFDGTCTFLKVEKPPTGDCVKNCEDNEACTDVYAGADRCVFYSCPDIEASERKLHPDSKHPGLWYGCKDQLSETISMQKAESEAPTGFVVNMLAGIGLAVTLFGAFRFYTTK